MLLYSPSWDDGVRVLATGAQFEGVATAGGRVAFVGGSASRDGVRVSVLSGDGAVVYRGPWVSDATGLAFDGRSLAFRTGGCGYAGPVGAWEARLPAGPCGRSEVTVDAQIESRRLTAARHVHQRRRRRSAGSRPSRARSAERSPGGPPRACGAAVPVT